MIHRAEHGAQFPRGFAPSCRFPGRRRCVSWASACLCPLHLPLLPLLPYRLPSYFLVHKEQVSKLEKAHILISGRISWLNIRFFKIFHVFFVIGRKNFNTFIFLFSYFNLLLCVLAFPPFLFNSEFDILSARCPTYPTLNQLNF